MSVTESWASSDAVRRSMQGNRSRDTSPEMAVRRELHRRGYRYRVAARVVPENKRNTVDIVFPRERLAVFVDGCFWHGCAEHYRQPGSNTEYWSTKIERNQQRDAEVSERLSADGWKVARFWEHEPALAVADRVEQLVLAARVAKSLR